MRNICRASQPRSSSGRLARPRICPDSGGRIVQVRMASFVFSDGRPSTFSEALQTHLTFSAEPGHLPADDGKTLCSGSSFATLSEPQSAFVCTGQDGLQDRLSAPSEAGAGRLPQPKDSEHSDHRPQKTATRSDGAWCDRSRLYGKEQYCSMPCPQHFSMLDMLACFLPREDYSQLRNAMTLADILQVQLLPGAL